MVRLFIALLPPAGLHGLLAPVLGGVSGARWQTAEQLHITLRFVGAISGRPVNGLIDRLAALNPAISPIGLSGVGRFNAPGGHPNALWLRALPKAQLDALHHKLDRMCQAEGIEPERRAFLPHMTVARLSRSAGPADAWLARNAGFSTPPLIFRSLALMESLPTQDGSQYDVLWERRLEPSKRPDS